MKLRLGKPSHNNRHSRQQEHPFMSISFILLLKFQKKKKKAAAGALGLSSFKASISNVWNVTGPLKMDCCCRREVLPSPLSVAHIYVSQKT